LTPASGHQDHATSPSTFSSFVRRPAASTASRAQRRDDAYAPPAEAGRRELVPVICPTAQAQPPATRWYDGQITSRPQTVVKHNLVVSPRRSILSCLPSDAARARLQSWNRRCNRPCSRQTRFARRVLVQGRAASNGCTFAPPAIRGLDGSKCSCSSRSRTSERASTNASFRLAACRSATLKNASPK
jgi:hypothetical protein